jgi:transposase InsO family protein
MTKRIHSSLGYLTTVEYEAGRGSGTEVVLEKAPLRNT